jgi:hypothetical protein
MLQHLIVLLSELVASGTDPLARQDLNGGNVRLRLGERAYDALQVGISKIALGVTWCELKTKVGLAIADF